MLYATLLTDKNVSHDCYVFFAIIWWILSYISTSVETEMRSIYAKSNSRVARTTVILFITYDADSCLGTKTNWPHWTPPCCIPSARRPLNQLETSTCYDPVKWRGVARQRSVKIGSLPPVLRQWNGFVGRLSYRGRSLWRMCSSRSLAWFLVSRTQSALQQDCIPVDWSNT